MSNERQNVGGVSIQSANGAPPRKGCVVDGQITEVSNNIVSPLPPPNEESLPEAETRRKYMHRCAESKPNIVWQNAKCTERNATCRSR